MGVGIKSDRARRAVFSFAASDGRNSAVIGGVDDSIGRNGPDRKREQVLGRSGADSGGENGGNGEDLHFEWWFKMNLEDA